MFRGQPFAIASLNIPEVTEINYSSLPRLRNYWLLSVCKAYLRYLKAPPAHIFALDSYLR